MRRTKFLSVVTIIILTLDLLLGILNIYNPSFLDKDGDIAQNIDILYALFGNANINKAITHISQEKMIPTTQIVKQLLEFIYYTNEQLAYDIVENYMLQTNNYIELVEFNFDSSVINNYYRMLSTQEYALDIANKRNSLRQHNVYKVNIYLIPHQYGDIVFDELLTKRIGIYNKNAVVLLKYTPSEYLDVVDTNPLLSNANKSIRYTTGDFVSLYRNLEAICIKDMPTTKKTIVNTSSYLFELLFNSRKTILYTQNGSYAITIYPQDIINIQIEKKHTASSPIYCYIVNKWMHKFGVGNRFITTHGHNKSKFNFIGSLVFVDKFINYNMLASVLNITNIESNKLYNILRCIDTDILLQQKATVQITQFGIMYFEFCEMSDAEVNEAYHQLISSNHAIKSTSRTKFKTHAIQYKYIPFTPMHDRLFYKHFGIRYKDIKPGYEYIIPDYTNNKFYVLTRKYTHQTNKTKYPCYSAINMIEAHTIQARL